MSNTKSAIILFGATGVGKSNFSEQVAQELPVEIINMDSGSFYAPLNIGTAKPNWRQSPVVHHLFDIMDKPEHITVITYRALVKNLLPDIWKRNKIPLFVGGSGFYLKSLLKPPMTIYKKETIQPDSDGPPTWEQLNTIDPIRAQQIHPQDSYRIQRALDIWRTTGYKPSEIKPVDDPLFDSYSLLYLYRDKQDLYKRINARVDQMLQNGLVKEVQNVCTDTKWRSFLKKKKFIGYSELLERNELKKEDLPSLTDTIKRRTRNYAKRQSIFWRWLQKELKIATTKDRKIIVHTIDATADISVVCKEEIVRSVKLLARG